MSTVRPGSFLTLHYRLSGPGGAPVVDTFGQQPATLSLGQGLLAPAMERRLIGLAEGAQASFELAPGEAFGDRNPQLVQRVSQALLAEHGEAGARYEVGEVIDFPVPGGQGRYAGVVRQADDTGLLVDFNHPLAGQPLRFEVRIVGVLE